MVLKLNIWRSRLVFTKYKTTLEINVKLTYIFSRIHLELPNAKLLILASYHTFTFGLKY